jgi:hypothetical protein
VARDHSIPIIDTHPQKEHVIKQLMDGVSVRRIGAEANPPIVPSVVNRYKNQVVVPLMKHVLAHPECVSEGTYSSEIPRLPRGKSTNDLAALVRQFTETEEGVVMIRATRKAYRAAIEHPVPKLVADAKPIASMFRQRLEDAYQRIERLLERAEKSPDITAAAPLLNQAHRNIELLGRTTGELDPQERAGIAIQIICPSTPSNGTPRVTYHANNINQVPIEEIGLIQK